jgi:signal transduction histidine kinase
VSAGPRPVLWRLAAGFVVVTLLALVVLPWVVQRRVTELREEIVASEPARTLLVRWALSLASEITALEALAREHDAADVEAYRTARVEGEAALRELVPLASRLGPDVVEALEAARAQVRAWHARTAGQSPAGGVPSAAAIDTERGLFEEARASMAAVDSVILDATATARTRIGAAEQTELTLTVVLGILALLAAVAALSLEAGLRRFAREAERRRLEAAEALAAAARATEARTSLLRGITHDVKNPLGAASGYAELLEMEVKAPLAPEQAPLVQGVQRSINAALQIIGDLLDLARLESGGLRVERVEVDLNALAREAVEDHQGAAQAAGHALAAETPLERVPVHTDPARVRQVIDNLISNAIKYTPPPGRITVSAVVDGGEGSSGDGAWATLRVSDNGPGIPADQREAIFDEFSRLDDESPTKGHGLGLAIARGIARRLNGDLFVADSKEGATFELRLPLRK